MDSKGERVQNGIMFAKERRLMELEQASARLQEELQTLLEQNKRLKKQDADLSRQLTLLQTKSNMIEVESMQSERKKKELESSIGKASQQLQKAEQHHDEQHREMVEKQRELSKLEGQNNEKQLFVRRLQRENAINSKVAGGCGKLVSERDRIRKVVERDTREVKLLEDKLTAKEKFIRILQDKLAKQTQEENNPNRLNQAPKPSSNNLTKMVQSVEQLKLDKLKSFQRIVRSKNAVLLKSKSQHHR